jgi:flagellar hook-associated protein FlgK
MGFKGKNKKSDGYLKINNYIKKIDDLNQGICKLFVNKMG